MPPETAPIIVSAMFGEADFAWLDGLRRAHFPPERNHLPAHLTLFHHLPPSVLDELRRRIGDETRGVEAPRARLSGVMSLGRGVALRVESEVLGAIRARLADAFHPLLTPQDRAPWRGHVTIQNKVTPEEAATLRAAMNIDFRPKPVAISGLALWWYRGGPWEQIARYPFSRSARSRRS